MKREEEERLRRKDEAPLNLPPDHPVRRLFQRFRQQREARRLAEQVGQEPGGAPLGDPEKASIQGDQPKVQEVLASTSIVMVTESPPPTAVCSTSSVSRVILHHSNLVGCKSAEPLKAKGWARFKETVVKPEPWSSVSKAESLDTLPDRTKSHDEMSLKKTDSCDSGITKSDLRLDNVCDASTLQVSPVQPPTPSSNPLTLSPGLQQGSCSTPEQSLQASFLEFKEELQGGIRALNSRMAALEAQLAEMLPLLKSRNTSGSSSQSSHSPTPDSDKDSIS